MIFLDFCGFLFFLVLGFLGEALSAFAHLVQASDHKEDDKADDEEVDNGLEEVAVVDGGWLDAWDVGWDSDLEGTEVEAADEHGNYWHDDVIHEGIDNGGKSATDDDTDGKIHDRATVDKFFKLF